MSCVCVFCSRLDLKNAPSRGTSENPGVRRLVSRSVLCSRPAMEMSFVFDDLFDDEAFFGFAFEAEFVVFDRIQLAASEH